MNYRVLYRRFRPETFADIVGQDHIIPILKNQIISGNVAHAYLFSGPRGTGKTSAAKVFAKAVNCLDPQDGEACGKCDYCLNFEEGGLTDIVEIDAASNRGIDEIRRLKDNVGYLPASGRYRVYIIDEVHMLTAEAFNALLKTLEEPPAHIIFIFATTEQQKVLPTILSRCQRFDFRRIPDDVIVQRLQYVLGESGAQWDEAALKFIAANSDGALRDALTLTDKALAVTQGPLTEAAAFEALGYAGGEAVLAIAEAIADEDAARAFAALDEALKGGSDAGYIVGQLIEYFRCLMIYTQSNEAESLIAKNDKYLKSLAKSGVGASAEMLIAYVRVLSKVKSESRFLPFTRYLLETAILYLSDKSRVTDTLSLTARVDKLEKRLARLEQAPPAAYAAQQPAEKQPAPEPENDIPAQKPAHAAAQPQRKADKAQIAQLKKDIEFAAGYIQNRYRDIMLADIFNCLSVEDFDGETVYVCPTATAVHLMDVYEAKGGSEKLAEILSQRLKAPVKVEVVKKEKKKTAAGSVASSLEEVFGADVRPMDE
jgi:DNA polymerase-3 subunit gamma/tau